MTQISTVGADIPLDILLATGRYAGPLTWSTDRETLRADGWLEAKFAPWARSILEDWADGRFDALESVIFSRSDDNSHRLYYYVCELQARGLIGGPRALVFDVARLRRGASRAHMIAQVHKLAAHFELDEATLERGIALANGVRGERAAAPPPTASAPICLIAGTAPPDRRLHDMARAAGWRGEGQTLGDLWRDPGDVVNAHSGDPARAIGSQLHARQTGPRGQYDPARRVVEDARAAGARAAILWYTEQEEALVWHLPAQRRALEDAGLPVLSLTRRDWAARDGVERDIHDFLKGLTA